MRPPEFADVPPGPPLRSTASTSAPACRAATAADAPATPRPTTTTSTVCSKRTSLTSSAGTVVVLFLTGMLQAFPPAAASRVHVAPRILPQHRRSTRPLLAGHVV